MKRVHKVQIGPATRAVVLASYYNGTMNGGRQTIWKAQFSQMHPQSIIQMVKLTTRGASLVIFN